MGAGAAHTHVCAPFANTGPCCMRQQAGAAGNKWGGGTCGPYNSDVSLGPSAAAVSWGRHLSVRARGLGNRQQVCACVWCEDVHPRAARGGLASFLSTAHCVCVCVR